MRVAFLGSGHFGLPTLHWLAASGHEITHVITQPARGSGRGRRTTRTPVAAEAEKLGLRVLPVEDINQPEIIQEIQGAKPLFGLAIAFGQMLKEEFLGCMPGGCLNLHASLLPKYRGAAPINWAIVKGEEKSGVTVFRIVRRMDAGPILTSRWTMIKPEETAGELHDRLAAIGVDAVQAAFDLFEDGRIPEGEPQDDALATKAPKLKKTDGHIDWNRPAAEIAGHICGMTPWPGASTRFSAPDGRYENLSIMRAREAETSDDHAGGQPGEIDERLYVTAATGFVEILEVKPSSGRVMAWPDYVNGRHVKAGDRFVPVREEK